MKIRLLEDAELAVLLGQEGNFDDIIEADSGRAYVRYGVDKVWVSLVKKNRRCVYLVEVSSSVIIRKEIRRLVEKLLELVSTT